MNIKVIFMDIDTTILDFDAGAAAGMKDCFHKVRLVYKPEMFKVFTEENNKIWRRIEKGELSIDDLYYVRWQAILGHLGLEADGVQMEKDFRVCLYNSAIPVPGAKESLTYLAPKYCLCAASNGPYDQQINRLQKAGMLHFFKHCFVSEKIGADKPGKEFFDGCFRELPGILPQECMMIGDSLTADIAGGISYGLQTCWFDYHSTGLKPDTDIKPDHIITDLSQISKIL